MAINNEEVTDAAETALSSSPSSLSISKTSLLLVTSATTTGAEARTTPRSRRAVTLTDIMSHRKVLAALTVVLVLAMCGRITTVDALKCHMCGQYNEGVGSITPCLNYSDQYAHLYLKECSKKTEKFCVKYVSELSTVRDCATECEEKEIWETQTYCCNEDGCNGSSKLEPLLFVLPLVCYIFQALKALYQARR